MRKQCFVQKLNMESEDGFYKSSGRAAEVLLAETRTSMRTSVLQKSSHVFTRSKSFKTSNVIHIYILETIIQTYVRRNSPEWTL